MARKQKEDSMAQCICIERVEIPGVIKKLPESIKLVSGDLDVYRLLASVNEEAIIKSFKDAGKELEITVEQFFYGSNLAHAIGFVRLGKELRIFERPADCLVELPNGDRQVYRMRDAGTNFFAPASQAPEPSWWRETIRF